VPPSHEGDLPYPAGAATTTTGKMPSNTSLDESSLGRGNGFSSRWRKQLALDYRVHVSIAGHALESVVVVIRTYLTPNFG